MAASQQCHKHQQTILGEKCLFFFKGLPALSKLTLFECSSFVCQQGWDSTEDLTDDFHPDY